jgi:hypothetical protein
MLRQAGEVIRRRQTDTKCLVEHRSRSCWCVTRHWRLLAGANVCLLLPQLIFNPATTSAATFCTQPQQWRRLRKYPPPIQARAAGSQANSISVEQEASARAAKLRLAPSLPPDGRRKSRRRRSPRKSRRPHGKSKSVSAFSISRQV